MVAASKQAGLVLRGRDGEVVTKAVLTKAKKTLTKIERDAIWWIQSYLSLNRAEILQTKAQLEEGEVRDTVESRGADHRDKAAFPSTYTTFYKLPRWWMAEFLHFKLGWTKDLVDLVASFGKHHQLKELFAFFFGAGEHDHWPQSVHIKDILALYLCMRGKAMGSRWVGFEQYIDKTNGKIDWVAAGPFAMSWGGADAEGDKILASITHKSSMTVVKGSALRMIITSGYEVSQPWDDMHMQFHGDDDLQPTAAALFSKNNAEWKTIFSRATVDSTAAAAVAQHEANIIKVDHEGHLQTEKNRKKAAAKAAALARVKGKDIRVPLGSK